MKKKCFVLFQFVLSLILEIWSDVKMRLKNLLSFIGKIGKRMAKILKKVLIKNIIKMMNKLLLSNKKVRN